MVKPAASAQTPLASDLLKVCEAIEVRYGRRKHQTYDDVIEALVFQILDLGVTEKTSRDTLKRLRDEFIDWNDMRVATVREIEDVLGVRYPKARERAEDLRHLLADLYTAFRRMDIREALAGDGIETLRALPETSNIRRDFVDRALLLAVGITVFPCDEYQLRLLKYLGAAPKPWTLQQAQRRIEEALDTEGLDRLSRVLREHSHICQEAGEEEPQGIAYGWDKPDPLAGTKFAKISAAATKPAKAVKVAKVENAKPAPVAKTKPAPVAKTKAAAPNKAKPAAKPKPAVAKKSPTKKK